MSKRRIVGEPCPTCYVVVTEWSEREAYRRKVVNARLSAKKAVLRGNHRHGRNRKLNYEQHIEIKNLYSVKFNRPSLRKLARKFDVSVATIKRVLNNDYKDQPK